MLKYIEESQEPPLSCNNLTYLLHFGPILLYAVEFFNALMIILGRVSDKRSIRSTRRLCAKSDRLSRGGRRK